MSFYCKEVNGTCKIRHGINQEMEKNTTCITASMVSLSNTSTLWSWSLVGLTNPNVKWMFIQQMPTLRKQREQHGLSQEKEKKILHIMVFMKYNIHVVIMVIDHPDKLQQKLKMFIWQMPRVILCDLGDKSLVELPRGSCFSMFFFSHLLEHPFHTFLRLCCIAHSGSYLQKMTGHAIYSIYSSVSIWSSPCPSCEVTIILYCWNLMGIEHWTLRSSGASSKCRFTFVDYFLDVSFMSQDQTRYEIWPSRICHRCFGLHQLVTSSNKN